MFYYDQQDQSSPTNADARSESFFYALKTNFCSTLRWKSFSIIFLIIMWILFIIQRIVDGIYKPGELLQVNSDGPYTALLSMSYQDLKAGQVWRLLTGLLGFNHMQQAISITIITLFFVSMTESVHGFKICVGNLFFINIYLESDL